MRHLTLLLLVGGVLLTPLLAGATADGDACPTTGRSSKRGWEVRCNYICASKGSGDSTCSTFTVDEAADTYAFEISTATGCTGDATATFTNKGLTTTTGHTLTLVNLGPGATGGATESVIDGSAAHPLTFITTALTNMTNCTAGTFDVKLWRWYRRVQ